MKLGLVAPRTGRIGVAPRVGAWIETFNKITAAGDDRGRAPRGRVD